MVEVKVIFIPPEQIVIFELATSVLLETVYVWPFFCPQHFDHFNTFALVVQDSCLCNKPIFSLAAL